MDFSTAFVQATTAYNTFEAPVAAPYIRRSFTAAAGEGRLRIAVCGFYELYINGQRCTKGRLAPYISNPDDLVYYDEYTLALQAGENVIGVWLGNGFQNNPGGYAWEFDKAPYRSAPQLALELTYTDAAGGQQVLLSDTSFRTAPSPLLADDYRFGETYDACRELPGWNEPGFDDSGWQPVIPVRAPRGVLRRCEAEPILVAEERRPVKIWPEDDGFVYDFGVSDAGVCRLTVNAAAGQQIQLRHAEQLLDGRFYLDNCWFPYESRSWDYYKHIVHLDTYTCREGEQSYTPTFVYHGFRYVKVTGITAQQATPELLTYVVMHSALRSRGGFACSDETVNKLQEMTHRSDLSNFYYFPTDCPHREKNGWTADAALSSEQVLINFAAENSYREWLRNICLAQNAEGALPGVVPTGGWGFEWGNGPAWDSVLACLPYFVYVYRGETAMIRESAHAFMAYLHYLTTRADEDGLLHIGLGDWCPVNRQAPDNYQVPLEFTDTLMGMEIARKMAVMFAAVDMLPQRDFARAVEERFRTAIRTKLVDLSTMTVAGNSQSGQALAIYYHVFTPVEARVAFDRLLEMVHAADDHMDVGVLGGRVLFRVLSAYGYSDLALHMITRPDFPSYGNWIARGATTLWEDFFPDTVHSCNHHFWGDISAWFITCLAGIHFNPQEEDVRRVEFRPSFVSALDWAEGWYEAPAGLIRCRWQREGEAIRLQLEVPQGVRAFLSLESGYQLESGIACGAVHSGEYRIVPVATR